MDIEDFTNREIEVMEAVAEGLTDDAIGTRLNVTRYAVKHHLRNIYPKMDVEKLPGVNQRVQAVSVYLEHRHDEHMRAIRAHLQSKQANGDGRC